mgnify:CR=1 FL=1
MRESSIDPAKNIWYGREHNVNILLENPNALGKRCRPGVRMTRWNDMANTNDAKLIIRHWETN